MRQSFFKLSIALCITAGLFSCKNKETTELTDLRDSASYCIGYVLGTNMAQQNMDSINLSAFEKGFIESKTPENFSISQEEISTIIQNFSLAALEQKYEPQIKENKEFLKNNSEKKGIITTASGLQYEIIKEGNGPKASLYDTISVNYNGTLLDGTVFDSNSGHELVNLPLIPGYLIEGWIEAFQLFNEGTKAKLYIPYDLGYGANGFQTVPPFATLIFEVELVKITKGQAPDYGQQPMFK